MNRTRIVVIILLATLCATGCARVNVADAPAQDEQKPAASTPTPEPEPTPDEGSREAPYSYGSVADLTEYDQSVWQITLTAPQTGATDTVMNENQFNDVPPPGSEWVLLPVSVTRIAEEPKAPWLDFEFAFVTAGGLTIEESYGVIPSSFSDISDLYAGGSATGNVGFVIPSAEIAAGAWRVTWGYTLDFFLQIVRRGRLRP